MKKKMFLVLTILLGIVLVSGVSYAFFTVIISGNDTAKENVVVTGDMELTYTDGDEISLNNAFPGDSVSKTFTVKNTGTLTTTYNIKMVDVVNTFVDKSDLIYTLTGDNGVSVVDEVVPSESGKYLTTKVTIDPNVVHTYSLTITFKKTTDDQNDNQGVTFSGKINIDVEKIIYQDNSGANAPVLEDNMIPVYYDGTNWKYAALYDKWYDYDDKEWANAVVLNDGVIKNIGDTITEEDIALWYVWIPRYTYTIFNGNNEEVSEQTIIEISFETGTSSTGTVECVDNVTGNGTSSETCTDTTNGSIVNGTSTYTHPAFTFGDTELTGFWVGKFEVSGTTDKITIKPNVSSLREQNVSAFFTAIQNIKYVYNLSGDSHMIKNMEWGAVAYLSHSKYGTCIDDYGCSEVRANLNENYYTGGGKDDAYKIMVYESSTENVYGVYDMSGGSREYVMGNTVSSTGVFYPSSTGFITENIPDSKYFNLYTYGISYLTNSRGKLGDATKETIKMFGNDTYGWFDDYADFPNKTDSWFERGGYYRDDESAGIFNFNRSTGGAYVNRSTRGVVCVQ